MPVESLDGRKHHHGDHNREKVLRERERHCCCPWHDRCAWAFPGWNNIGEEEEAGKNCVLVYSFFFSCWLKQTTNNPLGRLAADWLVSVEMAAPTHTHTHTHPNAPHGLSPQLSLFPYGNYYTQTPPLTSLSVWNPFLFFSLINFSTPDKKFLEQNFKKILKYLTLTVRWSVGRFTFKWPDFFFKEGF